MDYLEKRLAAQAKRETDRDRILGMVRPGEACPYPNGTVYVKDKHGRVWEARPPCKGGLSWGIYRDTLCVRSVGAADGVAALAQIPQSAFDNI